MAALERRPVLCADFDGTIHSYDGVFVPVLTSDPPVEGAIEWLHAVAQVADIVVCSARIEGTTDVKAIQDWLLAQGYDGPVTIQREKPQADWYVDDRGWQFNGPGSFPSVEALLAFRPWWKLHPELPPVAGHTPQDLAGSVVARAQMMEPTISDIVQASVEASGGELIPDNRVKSSISTADKISVVAAEKNLALTDAADDVKDGLRYAAIFPDGYYLSGIAMTLGQLDANQITTDRLRNYWDDTQDPSPRDAPGTYLAVNAVLEAPNGYQFEMQFHTPDGWRANAIDNWELYRQSRDPDLTDAEREQIWEKMRNNLHDVETPPGILALHAAGPPKPPHVSPRAHNAVLKAANKRVDDLEGRLADIIEPILAAAGTKAAARFRQHAVRLVAAGDFEEESLTAAGPEWSAPFPDQLIDVDALVAQILQKTEPVRRAMIEQTMTPALEQAGLSWDVNNPLTSQMLARSADQVTNIAMTTRANLMKIISSAYQNGLTVPQTAGLIREGMAAASKTRATMIARTELGRAVNGGSLAATQLVAKATGQNYQKVWNTAPGARYPRHEDYPGLDGQTRDMNDTFDVGGDSLQYPGDPDGEPGETINCRCTLTYTEEPGAAAAQDAISAEPSLGQRIAGDLKSLVTDESGAVKVTVPWPKPELVTSDLGEAAKGLAAGRNVMLKQGVNVSTFIDDLGKMAADARKAGTAAPDLDLGKVSIQGTNLFTQDSLGIPRVDMPQLEGLPIAGSPASKLPTTIFEGKVSQWRDISQPFFKSLQDQGVKVTSEKVDPETLRATQDQLNGAKVARMMDDMEAEKAIPENIVVSSDNYILDGHHHWAASIGRDWETGVDVPTPIQVTRIDEPISTLLQQARDYSHDMGIPSESAFQSESAATVKPAAETTYRSVHTAPDFTSGEPMSDIAGDKAYPADVYSADRERLYGTGMDAEDAESWAAVDAARNNPDALITVYRGVPDDVTKINPGDWVTPSRSYAESHAAANLGEAGPGHVISEQIRAGDLYTNGDSINEWGWSPPITAQGDAAMRTVDIGITPFRAGLDNKVGFYDSKKYSQFVQDVHESAQSYGVTVDGLDKVTGVWEGQTEPSVALRAHDGDLGVRAYAGNLGQAYNQDGVLLFTPDPTGESFMATFKDVLPHDQVERVMKKAGISGYRFDATDHLQVVGAGEKDARAVNEAAANLHTDATVLRGRSDLMTRDADHYQQALADFANADPNIPPKPEPVQPSSLFPGQSKQDAVAVADNQDAAVKKFAAEDGMTPQQYRAAAQQVIQDYVSSHPQVRIRVTDEALEKILRDGRFKSEFEIPGTPASFREPRVEAEKHLFGYPSNLPPTDRPIYGYLAGSADEGGEIGEYGDIIVNLSQDVNQRSTFVMGDSFRAGIADRLSPTLLSNPGLGSWDGGFDIVRAAQAGENLSDLLPYVEVQIHGGLDVADIGAINVDQDLLFQREEAIRLKDAVESLVELSANYAGQQAVQAVDAQGLPTEEPTSVDVAKSLRDIAKQADARSGVIDQLLAEAGLRKREEQSFGGLH